MTCNPQIYLVVFLLNLPDGKAASVGLEQPPVNLDKNSSRPDGEPALSDTLWRLRRFWRQRTSDASRTTVMEEQMEAPARLRRS